MEELGELELDNNNTRYNFYKYFIHQLCVEYGQSSKEDKIFIEKYIDVLVDEIPVEEQPYEVLMARGFLIEKEEKGYVFAKEEIEEGYLFLGAYLEYFHMGCVKDKSILINEQVGLENFYPLFTIRKYGGETSFSTISKSWFEFRFYTNKLQLSAMELDPWIARYVRAVILAGVETQMSCDESHKCNQVRKVWITYAGEYDLYWHKRILRVLGLEIFPWKNLRSQSEIKYSRENMVTIFNQLNQAAAKIFQNRNDLIEIKSSICEIVQDKINNSRKSQEEIIKMMEEVVL